MGMRRRRRDAEDVCRPEFDPQTNPELMQGVMAFTSMFGGFLSIINETGGEECKKLSLCRATRDARRHGSVGNVIARASAENILQRPGMESLTAAAETGLKSGEC